MTINIIYGIPLMIIKGSLSEFEYDLESYLKRNKTLKFIENNYVGNKTLLKIAAIASGYYQDSYIHSKNNYEILIAAKKNYFPNSNAFKNSFYLPTTYLEISQWLKSQSQQP